MAEAMETTVFGDSDIESKFTQKQFQKHEDSNDSNE